MQRTVIARWESKRGKDYVEVYEQASAFTGEGYGYHTRNGGGWMGHIPRAAALMLIERRVADGCFCSQKTPMRKVLLHDVQ